MRVGALSGAFVLCFIFQSATASATTITISGTVSSVDIGLTGTYIFGEAFQASFDYTPASTSNNSGHYAFQNLTVTVGNDSGGNASALGITVHNDAPFDEFIVYTSISGTAVLGLLGPSFYFALADSNSTVFTDGSLPSLLPPLTDFEGKSAFLSYEDVAANASRRVGLTVTGVISTASPVPEPGSTLTLLSLGLAGMFGVRGRFRKRQ